MSALEQISWYARRYRRNLQRHRVSIFANDSRQFASPHPDALNAQKSEAVVRAIDAVLAEINPSA
jgi:uracil-DNA glycosylase